MSYTSIYRPIIYNTRVYVDREYCDSGEQSVGKSKCSLRNVEKRRFGTRRQSASRENWREEDLTMSHAGLLALPLRMLECGTDDSIHEVLGYPSLFAKGFSALYKQRSER